MVEPINYFGESAPLAQPVPEEPNTYTVYQTPENRMEVNFKWGEKKVHK